MAIAPPMRNEGVRRPVTARSEPRYLPLPASGTVCGLLLALSPIVRLSPCAPLLDASKRIATRQLLPGGKVIPTTQVLRVASI